MFKGEASSETYGPRVYFNYIVKFKNTLLHFYFAFFFIYLSLLDFILAINAKGLSTPCLRWVQVFLILCVGVVHEGLRGSPTGLINLVLNRGKYLSLLYCIILSSSRKYQRNLEVAGTSYGRVPP